MKCTIIPAECLVTVRFKGCVTIADIAAYAAELQGNAGFRRDFSEIVDLSDVTEFRIEPKDAMALADRIDPYALSARRAFVVKNDAQYHMARMHQLLRGGTRMIGIFASAEEAKAWLLDKQPERSLGLDTPQRLGARRGG